MSIAGKRMKKIFCMVLAAAVLTAQAAIMVPTAVFAENSYEYKPARQKYAIAPGALYTDPDFYNSYVKTDAVWAFNSITYFTDNALNYGTEKVGYNAGFKKSLDSSTVDPVFDPILESLRKKGDLLVNFRVSLANNGGYKQFAGFRHTKDYGDYQTASDYRDYGEMEYIKWKWGGYVDLYYSASAAGLGSRMKNSALVFADATSPKTKEVYATSGIDGPAVTSFNGEAAVAYINVKFDENIRFSDNNRIDDTHPADHSNIWLELKVGSIDGGSTINDAYQRARLVRLKGDTLTFEYDIPDKIKGDDLNHCITGIEGIVEDVNGDDVNGVYGNNDDADALNNAGNPYSLRVLTYTGELYGHHTSSGLVPYKSRSLITDAAGNPASLDVTGPKNQIYLDKVSPYIAKVSFDAPEARNEVYLGPGYKIMPSVTFNEALYKYKRHKQTGASSFEPMEDTPGYFEATLNIKDQSGNYLTVSGSSYDKDSKVLKFNTLALPDGAHVDGDDKKIKITSISIQPEEGLFTITVMDARRNTLANPIDSSSLPTPSGEFIPDTDKPAIATDFNMPEGKYTPTAYDSDGDGKNDSFYFSFGLTDAGSGVLPSHNGDNLMGSFGWGLDSSRNDAAVIESLSFQYSFDDSADPPGPDKWESGKFGRDYPFTERGRAAGAADNIYLHIKADGLEGADLGESTLSVGAVDLVGNRTEKDFLLDGGGLNSMLDRTPPGITVNKLYTYKDGGGWKFAAEFTLTDKSNVDAGEVYSQWADGGDGPAENGWVPVSGLGADDKTVAATVEYPLTDDEMNSKDLYIKAIDCSNNKNTLQSGPYAFARDLRKPVYEAEVSGGMTEKAALAINAEAQSTTITEGESTLTVPAVILVTVGNSYKAIDLTTPAAIDVFAGADGWYNTADGAPAADDTLSGILNGTYYGKIDVSVDIGYGISYSGGTIQDPYDSLATGDYTLYTAPSSEPIHDIGLTSSLADPADGWNSPADGPKYYTDPAGATFHVTVDNVRMPGWDSKDADFENSFFAIYKAGDSDPVFTSPIGMASTITVPEGLNLSTGDYYAKAAVTAKTSGRVDESDHFRFRIDTTKPEDFGLSRTETLWRPEDPDDPDVTDLFGKIGSGAVLYGYDSVHNSGAETYDSAPTIFLGSGDNGLAAAERKLYFTTKSTNDEFYIKVWNATAGVDEVRSKAEAEWRNISDTADSAGGAGFTASVVGSAAEVVTGYSPGVIPVINNAENIIKYQSCHANGIDSVEKVLLAEVSDEEPELDAALTPEGTAPAKEVTAKITRLYSPSSPDMEAFYWAGGSDAEPKPADGNISLLQEDNNWFYASNIYGNYTILNKTAPSLDADAPVLEGTDFWQDEGPYGDLYTFRITIIDKNPWDLYMKFDDAYMARLGLSGYFRLEVPEPEASETEATWIADSPRSDGIYKIVRTDDPEIPGPDNPERVVTLDITGVYLYDDGGGSPPATVDVGYSLFARDVVGNENTFDAPVSPVKNARPVLKLDETTVKEDVLFYNIYETPPEEYIEMSLYSLRASFNLPVRNVTPLQHHNAENSYSLIKNFLSIFKDGTYTVTYQDIFGRNYSEEKNVSVRDDNDMTISMTGLDAENKYTMSVKPVANEAWQLPQDIPLDKGKAFTVFENIYNAPSHSSARMLVDGQFDRDDTVIIAMMKYDPRGAGGPGWYPEDDSDVPLILIDGSTRQAPVAEVHWYYHEFASDTVPAGETETDGEVDVWVTADTPITGAISHTFTYGDAQGLEHTFEYANSDGLTGSTTVILPVTVNPDKVHQGGGEQFRDPDLHIDEDELYKAPPDTTPPGVIFKVYGNYGSVLRDKGEWYNGTGGDMKPLFTWASAFVLKADIIDESGTKIILLKGASPDIGGITYDNAQSAAIQGVTLDGSKIRITRQVTDPATAAVTTPESFTVLLIDEKNYKTAVSFPSDNGLWDQLDVLAPWLDSLSYTKTSFTEVDATFKLKDDKTPGGQIELLSPTGLAYDPAAGEYTMTFTENTTVQTTIRDLAGNVGTGTVSVTELDDEPPAVAFVWWSKGYVDSNKGENDPTRYDPTRLTTERTNQTVTAKLTFNKPVKDVNLAVYEDHDHLIAGSPVSVEADYVTWTWDTNGVVINFLQNADLLISFTALNDIMNTPYELSVENIIDKSIPNVTTVIDDRADATTAAVTFTNPGDVGEPVHVYGPGETGKQLFDPGDVLTKTFTRQGTYIFRFTDEAGNTHTENVKIENIDEYPPGILTADLPAAGTYFKDPVIFKATMSEAGTLTFNGITKDVNAPVDDNHDGKIDADPNDNGKVDAGENECDWVTFTAAQNGNFPITAVDAAGRKTTAYVAISSFDKAGPVISFEPANVTVMSGTDSSSFLALLEQGVTVTDNSTAAADIVLTHGDAAAVNLSVPGQYAVEFTATDLAGNATTAKRYVKVFSATEIRVEVNGIRTESNGTAVLDDQNVALAVSKLPMGDGEPYKVYLRKGIWTAGQMKGLAPLTLTQAGGFTLPEGDRFYTLYIVTQNRGTYLTYLYVQK